MIGFFDVICMSAPHIYHSALPLSPKMSIVHRLYEKYANPFVRVVQGLSTVWEPVAATVYCELPDNEIGWSPCNKFIALSKEGGIGILDAVTLRELSTLKHSVDFWCWDIVFSPDSHFLTSFNHQELTSWDLQTGGPIGTIPLGLDLKSGQAVSSTYSVDGQLVAVACEQWSEESSHSSIATYDFLSKTCTHSYHVSEEVIHPIWTHNEFFQFATVGPDSITIWEVLFTGGHGPSEVKSLSAPDEITDGVDLVFLSALCRLAFRVEKTMFIWDAKASKFLLKSEVILPSTNSIGTYRSSGSFSPDGCFFGCITYHSELHIWKESPIGYILYQKHTVNSAYPLGSLIFSPNRESVILSLANTVQLWSTNDEIIPSSLLDVNDRPSNTLAFSPNETFAALTTMEGKTVTILNLQSGNLQLAIDTGMEEIRCLGVTESMVVVADTEKIISWNIPMGDCTSNTRANINNSAQTIMLNYPALPDNEERRWCWMSMSPSLSQIVITITYTVHAYLYLYDVPTGKYLGCTTTQNLHSPWSFFTQDGCEIWYPSMSPKIGWKIIGDSKSGTVELKPTESVEYPLKIFPWHSLYGYEVKNNEWIMSPSQKHLLWLPHPWRSSCDNRKWSGKFLCLAHCELPQAVILEFLE